MKSVTITAMVALALTLVPACASEPAAATAQTASAQVQGRWSLDAVRTLEDHPARSIVSATLAFDSDGTWRLRYDYHVASTPLAHVWSSGLSGTWEAQPGDPVAVRFTVLDDRSTAVATMAAAARMEVTLMGLQMRFVRAPE